MIISCPNCSTAFNVSDEKRPPSGTKLRCFKCKEVFVFDAAPPVGPLVLVANESKAFCQTVADLLVENGLRADVVYDGAEALSKIKKMRPEVVLLDVALPTIFGFDVCERVKDDGEVSATKIILIAAIYDKTMYKRAPTSLYGADDYIEKHHIHDRLVDMIWKLTSLENAESAEEESVQATVSEEVEADIHKTSGDEFPAVEGEDHEKATRLARIIVSDIVLYNEDLVSEGIKNRTFHELLKEDIDEGRRLFRQRVPEEIWQKRDYLMESIDKFIEKHSTPTVN